MADGVGGDMAERRSGLPDPRSGGVRPEATEGSGLVRATDEGIAEAPLHGTVGISSRGASRRESSPHAHKFRAATALLVGFALGALAVAGAILASNRGHTSSVPWSSWSPPDNGTTGATEIADHLAPLYRISDTDQLAVVSVVNLANSNAVEQEEESGGTSTTPPSGLEVAVKPDANSSAVSLLTGNTIAYDLCGIGGSNCAIGVGQASASRLLLLRREALELALYTFKYISNTDNVVAILPPGYTSESCTGLCPKPNQRATIKPVDIAVLFLREELQPWLSQPLNETLPEEFPPTVSQMASAPEAGLVDQITARGLFSESVEQSQDGSNLLVLNPMPPQ
jgi:hypothetical protein